MATGRAGLERWSAEEFAARALTPPQEGADGAGAAAVATTTLVLFDRGTPADRRLAAALAAAAADHADRVRAAAVAAADVQAHVDAWEAHRAAVHTFDFRSAPVVGVFRRGRLVTTFNPRLVFFPDRLQQREDREQLEIFLAKMVYFDPSKVKAQKTVEVGAEA